MIGRIFTAKILIFFAVKMGFVSCLGLISVASDRYGTSRLLQCGTNRRENVIDAACAWDGFEQTLPLVIGD